MANSVDDTLDRTSATVDPLRAGIDVGAMTEQRLQKTRDELAVLYGISALANQSLNLKIFLSESLSRTAQALQSDQGIVFLLDGDQSAGRPDRLVVAADQGISLDGLRQLQAIICHRGIADWVIDHRDALVIPELSKDLRFPAEMLRMGDVALVLAPIRAEARVSGIIGLARPRQHAFRGEEIVLLSSIADQIGVAIRSDYLRQRAQRANLLEERQRLARDLHDSVTQALYSVLLLADASRESAEGGDLAQTRRHVTDLAEIAHQALKEMRLLIHDLRPQALEREGLVEALRQRLKAVENRAGVRSELVTDGNLELPVEAKINLYRIAEEALNNILKHSGATQVSMTLGARGNSLCLEIKDNGIGFDAELAAGQAGIGLASMRERADQLGGRLEIYSQPGSGTHIRLSLPFPPAFTDEVVRGPS
jgi:signal transduction histidine kinase